MQLKLCFIICRLSTCIFFKYIYMDIVSHYHIVSIILRKLVSLQHRLCWTNRLGCHLSGNSAKLSGEATHNANFNPGQYITHALGEQSVPMKDRSSRKHADASRCLRDLSTRRLWHLLLFRVGDGSEPAIGRREIVEHARGIKAGCH